MVKASQMRPLLQLTDDDNAEYDIFLYAPEGVTTTEEVEARCVPEITRVFDEVKADLGDAEWSISDAIERLEALGYTQVVPILAGSCS